MGFIEVEAKLKENGLKRIVQRSVLSDFGLNGNIVYTWADTEWDNVEKAESYFPNEVFRNVVIQDVDLFADEVLKQPLDLYNEIEGDLERAGIPISGCPWNCASPDCEYK